MHNSALKLEKVQILIIIIFKYPKLRMNTLAPVF